MLSPETKLVEYKENRNPVQEVQGETEKPNAEKLVCMTVVGIPPQLDDMETDEGSRTQGNTQLVPGCLLYTSPSPRD